MLFSHRSASIKVFFKLRLRINLKIFRQWIHGKWTHCPNTATCNWNWEPTCLSERMSPRTCIKEKITYMVKRQLLKRLKANGSIRKFKGIWAIWGVPKGEYFKFFVCTKLSHLAYPRVCCHQVVILVKVKVDLKRCHWDGMEGELSI